MDFPYYGVVNLRSDKLNMDQNMNIKKNHPPAFKTKVVLEALKGVETTGRRYWGVLCRPLVGIKDKNFYQHYSSMCLVVSRGNMLNTNILLHLLLESIGNS